MSEEARKIQNITVSIKRVGGYEMLKSVEWIPWKPKLHEMKHEKETKRKQNTYHKAGYCGL